MASEAEIERLYQLFVTNGGGALSFSGANLTPKQYSDAIATSNLTPLEMAQLESRQHQFNRQKALNTIVTELDANSFNNPYAPRATYGSSLFSALGSTSGSINAGLINGGFSGFSDVNRALVVAGVLSQTGVDLEKIIKIAGLMTLGTAMYTSLSNHTNNQTANIPKTLEDASSLSTMNEQFGQQGDPCSFFNQLMGILAGVFDGTLDFIETAVGDISSLVNKTGIPAILSSILSALTGAAGGVVGAIASIVGLLVGSALTVLKALTPLVGKIINAIADITTQIASEISSLADMAAELLKKALALLIGSAATDPCKKAVLNNTGSDAMKGAITQLNQPLGTAAPGGIGTTVDTRANKDEVEKKMTQAQAEALLRAGVPQSPFTDAAKVYGTYDSALHSNASSLSLRPKTRPSTITSSTITESDEMPARRDGESMDEFMKRIGATRQATTEEKESTAMKSMEVVSLQARGQVREWQEKQKNYTRDSRAVISSMQTALSTKDFTNKTALKSRLTQLINAQYDSQEKVANLTNEYMDTFYYWTEGGKPSRVTEAKIRHIVNARIRPAQQRTYDNAVASLNSVKSEWDSIDIQIY
jgi:hypothetical protein|tara:strand:+ start:4314 stop:6086 length:1773 start_codon:yes stop_codon:yes gene_type:complete